MNKKQLLLIFLVIKLLLTLVTTSFIVSKVYVVKGDIREYQLDGCGFILESDEELYELTNYDGGEKNDTTVYLTNLESSGSFCMIGTVAKVILVL